MDNVSILTERLILRNLEKKDAHEVFKLWSTPLVNCYVPAKMDTMAQAYKHIEEANPEFDLAVCLRESDKLVGVLFGMFDPPDVFSPCWNFIPEHFGKGYATEAVSAYFNYLFMTKNMRRLYSLVEENNLASQKVCRKVGMCKEGVMKELISFVTYPDGTPLYENTCLFAILKSEWEKRQNSAFRTIYKTKPF